MEIPIKTKFLLLKHYLIAQLLVLTTLNYHMDIEDVMILLEISNPRKQE